MAVNFVSKLPIIHIPKTKNVTSVTSITRCLMRFHHSARLSAISASNARRRPTLKNSHQPSTTLKPLAFIGRRTIFIQTEETPNTNALKFLPNQSILPPGLESSFIEYLNPKSTLKPPYTSLLASKLMSNSDITSVFYGTNFITVTKSPDADWMYIKPEIFSLITEALTSGAPIVNVSKKNSQELNDSDVGKDSLSHDQNDSEVVGMIKELLELRIRPAIQEDGGDIDFKGFQDGQVLLKLRGACRTCDSSTVTLKNGIEAMLMHYIEEVKGVKQVLDEEEEVALREFARFEEKLHQQKDSEDKALGKTPTASSTSGLSGPETS